jgi:enolase
MAVTIASVKARQIFDSRGNPTVEVHGEVDRGGKGLVPCRFCASLFVW